ncbi:SDR family NAD(P)-dependent oxidoreductase, partial [Streptomyces albidochromogenes]
MTNPAETYEKTFTGQEPFIAQHRSAGTGLLPAAVQLEMAMVGVAQRRPFAPLELTDVTFRRPLTIAAHEAVPVRLDVTFGTRTRFELSTVVAGERKPLSTGTGRLLPEGAPVRPSGTGRNVTATRAITPQRLYDGWAREGLRYGPDFRTVRELAVGDGVARATLRSDAEPMPWYAHPLLVDGVFQVVSCALQDLTGADGPYPMLPIGVARLAVFTDLSALSAGVRVLVRRTGVDGAYATADALLLGPSDEVAAEFEGIRMRRTAAVSRPAAAPPRTRAAVLPITRIDWRPTPATDARHEPATGTWVVLGDGGPGSLGERAARQLRAEGARVVEVGVDPSRPQADGGDRRVLERPDEEAFRKLWEEVGDPIAGVLHLWNSDAVPAGAGAAKAEEAELRLGLYACLAAVRTLGERQRKSRFLVVTRDGQSVVDGDRPVPARAALWGFLRTAAIEYPGFHPRLVDVAQDPDDALRALLAELGASAGPTEVGYRQGVRRTPVRVRDRAAHAAPHAGPGPVRQGGRYLVLGGHGGLGLEVADRFAREGAGVVALVSRSAAAGAGNDRTAAIAARGCEVVSYSADATTPGALAAVVERIREEFGELHGVVHAAGTLKDGLIRTATAEDIAGVMSPKVDGARELAAAVAGVDLDFAVLFASVSGTFGNLGQGGYAAANAYLDAFAQAHGAPWLSVAWGLWGEVGMGTAVADQLRRRGVRPLVTEEGLDSLIALLGAEDGPRQVVVAHPDAGDTVVELDGPGEETGGSPMDTHTDVTGVAGETAATAEDARERVADALELFLAERLGTTSFDRGMPLSDYGMSSIMSVELSEELSRRWDVHLPATLFLEYGEFAELAQALTDRYGAAAAVAAPAAGAIVQTAEPSEIADPSETAETTGPTEHRPAASPA